MVENAIEIAFEKLEELQELLNVGDGLSTRQSVIHDYIIPWAVEAEEAYRKKEKEVGRENMEYYDFVSEFAEAKTAVLRKHEG